jgi:YidC/Oxa1 family membrane protein insertase
MNIVDIIKSTFTFLITQPITNILVAIYQLLSSVHVPYALGFAIIALTALIRILLFPIIAQQLRSSKKMQEIQPHINRLKEKHKGNMQKIQQESMQLYKEFGINPLAGCLPMLVQLPVIWGLYSVLNTTVRETSFQAINKLLYTDSLKLHVLWDTHFYGLQLTQSLSQLLKTAGPAILLIPVLTGLLQFVQSRMMFKQQPKKEPGAKTDGPDMAAAMQMQTQYMLPVMIGFFSYSLPFGLSLYWNTFTLFGILQQYLINRSMPTNTVVEAEVIQSPKSNKDQRRSKKRK